jgi:hypothetical protein
MPLGLSSILPVVLIAAELPSTKDCLFVVSMLPAALIMRELLFVTPAIEAVGVPDRLLRNANLAVLSVFEPNIKSSDALSGEITALLR